MPRVVAQVRVGLEQLDGAPHEWRPQVRPAGPDLGSTRQVRRDHRLLRIGRVGSGGGTLREVGEPDPIVDVVVDDGQIAQRAQQQASGGHGGRLLEQLGGACVRAAVQLERPQTGQHP